MIRILDFSRFQDLRGNLGIVKEKLEKHVSPVNRTTQPHASTKKNFT